MNRKKPALSGRSVSTRKNIFATATRGKRKSSRLMPKDLGKLTDLGIKEIV